MTMAPVLPELAAPPNDVVGTVVELARLDLEHATWSRREAELQSALAGEFRELHSLLRGSDLLEGCTQDLIERLDEYRESLGELRMLLASTECVNKEMIKYRREKEEQKLEKIRQESLIRLRKSRNELKDVAADLLRTTRQSLRELATLHSPKLLSTIHSEASLREIIDQTKLHRVCADPAFGALSELKTALETQGLVGEGAKTAPAHTADPPLTQLCGRLLTLVVAFRHLMDQICQSKADCHSACATPTGSTTGLHSESWAEELELLDDVEEDAEAVIGESFILCKILIVKRLEIITASGQRIPKTLVHIFSQTQNFRILVNLITDAPVAPINPPPILAIGGANVNYFYNMISEVTNTLKANIDRYYYVIHGFEDKICQPAESWAVFDSLLAKQRQRASELYEQFHAEVAKIGPVESQTVKDVHPFLHEALLICANILSVRKSVTRITQKIDRTREPLPWLDVDAVRGDLMKLASIYLQKAWESAQQLDDCGLPIDNPSSAVTAHQHGSTMVDDIFYVIKEVTLQVANLRDSDILLTYTSLVENVLRDIPSTLSDNAMKAIDIFVPPYLKAAPSGDFFTRVCVKDIIKPGVGNNSPKNPVRTITSSQSFPHALNSLHAIQIYAAQVLDQLLPPPTSPTTDSSPAPILKLTTASSMADKEGSTATLKEFYMNAYVTVKKEFARRTYDAFFSKQFFVPPSGQLDEEAIIAKLNALLEYFEQLWPRAVAAEETLELLDLVLSGLEQSVLSRINRSVNQPSVTDSIVASVSVLNVFSSSGGVAATEALKKTTDANVDPNTETVVSISFDEALEFDAVVRHLLEWADERLVELDVRDHFRQLLEICELITVECVTDILELSAQTQWHLEESIALKLLRARTDMDQYSQLDHVLQTLLNSGVFRQPQTP